MTTMKNAPPATIAIAGAGIVGLVLALALEKEISVKAELYEQASGFAEDVGAGMGMYPNGLKVLRDIDPKLFADVERLGHPYLYRRWERHDGSSVAVGQEYALAEHGLHPLGIRRSKLQRALYDRVKAKGVNINFKKKIIGIDCDRLDGLIEITFADGTTRLTRLLFGADGSRSRIRELLAGPEHQLRYTGVTCLMGMSNIARPRRGISFAMSTTTKCHAVFFPTSNNEQCFQFHFPTPESDIDQGNWATLTRRVGLHECHELAVNLRRDGWDEVYLAPLEKVTHAVRIGFCSLEPPLERLVFGKQSRVALLGDAAHPPVPYTGQGAQLGIEDAGVIAVLFRRLCIDVDGNFLPAAVGTALAVYEKMRIPRTQQILANARRMGSYHQRRSEDTRYNEVKEELLQRDVFFHDTMPIMFAGTQYDYVEDVRKVLKHEPLSSLPLVAEGLQEDA